MYLSIYPAWQPQWSKCAKAPAQTITQHNNTNTNNNNSIVFILLNLNKHIIYRDGIIP